MVRSLLYRRWKLRQHLCYEHDPDSATTGINRRFRVHSFSSTSLRPPRVTTGLNELTVEVNRTERSCRSLPYLEPVSSLSSSLESSQAAESGTAHLLHRSPHLRNPPNFHQIFLTLSARSNRINLFSKRNQFKNRRNLLLRLIDNTAQPST